MPFRGNSMKRPLVLTVLLAVLAGCGGGGGGGGDDGGGSTTVTFTGRALLGPLEGARVDLYRIDGLGSPIASVTTTSGGALSDAGRFTFDVDDSAVLDAAAYVLVVSGGQDRDADDDGTADPAPTPNNGTLHTVMSGADLKAGDFTVNLLTEALYQRVRGALAAHRGSATVLNEFDVRAPYLLKTSLDGNAAIDRHDVYRWDPATDGAASYTSAATRAALSASILAGTPDASGLLAMSNTIVGTIPVIAGESVQLIQASGTSLIVASNLTATRRARVRVFDIGTPTSPTLSGTVSFPTQFERVAMEGDVLAAVRQPAGAGDPDVLAYVDLSNPAAPTVRDAADVTFPVGVAVHDGRIYHADTARLTVYSTTGGALNATGTIDYDLVHGGGALAPGALAVNDEYAFVADGNDGDLAVLDLGGMAFDRLLVREAFSKFSNQQSAVANADYLYVSDNQTLSVFDLTTGNFERTILQATFSPRLTLLESGGLLAGNAVYAIGAGGSIAASTIAADDQTNTAPPIAFSGGFFYSAPTTGQPIVVVEGAAHRLVTPLAGRFDTPSTALAMVPIGGDSFAVLQRDRLQTVSVDAQGTVTSLGSVFVTSSVNSLGASLAFTDGFAVVASTGGKKVTVVDVRTPASPAIADERTFPDQPLRLAVSPGAAYVALIGNGGGQRIVRLAVSGTGTTTVAGSTPVADPANVFRMAWSNNRLYVSNSASSDTSPPEVRIFDTSGGAAPALTGSFTLEAADPPFPLLIGADGNRLFVTATDGKLRVYNTAGATPSLVDTEVVAAGSSMVVTSGTVYLLGRATTYYDRASSSVSQVFDLGDFAEGGGVSGTTLVTAGGGDVLTIPIVDPDSVP